MGERHQAFLIARVRPHGAQSGNPGQRRCIAGFHHQWCCGILPLLAMHRLITLMSHPENAAVVRWVFVLSRASKFCFTRKKNMWGFVHFTRSEEEPSGDAPTRQRMPVQKLGCSGRLYDLRGFLDCMASEGRPMPSEAAVKELEHILYKKHSKTGEFYCPLMGEEDAQEIEPTGSDRGFGERYDEMGFRS